MKSHTKSSLRAVPAAQVQISLPVQGVLRDVRHAFGSGIGLVNAKLWGIFVIKVGA